MFFGNGLEFGAFDAAMKFILDVGAWLRIMQGVVGCILLVASLVAFADDQELVRIKDQMESIRSKGEKLQEPDMASDRQNVQKAILDMGRWIDEQLFNMPEDLSGPEAIGNQLNARLKESGLLCEPDSKASVQCIHDNQGKADFNLLGYFGRFDVELARDGINVIASVGVACGTRDVVYRYEKTHGHWRRVFADELNIAGKDFSYTPLRIKDLLVSAPYPDSYRRIVLLLGYSDGCVSTWHSVYYRLYQLSEEGSRPKLLLNIDEFASILDEDGVVKGSVGSNDAYIEYIGASLEPGERYRVVRHYAVSDGKVTRIAPFGLAPRDFVMNWIAASREESDLFVKSRGKKRLNALHEGSTWQRFGEFTGPTLRCRSNTKEWQVGVGFDDGSAMGGERYFLVKWMPPHRLSLEDVSSGPWPGCTQPDDEADATQTLFWDQDRRP